MIGLRHRVTVGFMSIVGVLILAGVVSYIELSSLSYETENILNTSQRNRELANNMRAALQIQNNAFVQMTAFNNNNYDSICLRALDKLDVVLFEAHAETRTNYAAIDSMMSISTQLRDMTIDYITFSNNTTTEIVEIQTPIDETIIDETTIDQSDSIAEYQMSAAEYYAAYLPIHDKMSMSIDQYVTISQNTLAPRTEQLHNNAYRAVTPVLISLTVMIVIVLMLFFFMLKICVNPIVVMTRSLKDYILFKIPYAPKHPRRDELAELSNMIDTITNENSDFKRAKN